MITISFATKVRAHQLARQLVKDNIRRAGQKPSSVTHAELVRWAEVYVDENPTLIEQARAEVAAWIKQ